MEAFTFNTAELILLSAAGVLFIIQVIYYLGLYNRIHSHNKAVRKEETHFTRELPPLSVILCARNEADNLRKVLPAILEQDYPQFEVIVINDASTDETEDVLGFMEEKYPHLYHSFTPDSARYISHKKLALTLGIKACKYDWLVFTETNCIPASKDWLKLMARNFTSQTQVVLGYSGYDRTKGWLHKRVAFDTLFQSLRYLGLALAGKPYMGIGRNLAYRKELFFKQKGFSSYLNLQRGEDDLFINSVANSYNTQVAVHPDSIVRMPIPPYKRIWFEEKIGEHVTGHLYHGWARFSNAFETWTCALFHLITLAGLILSIISFQWIATGVFFLLGLIRFIIQMIVFRNTAKDMQEKLCCVFPVFDLFRPLLSLQLKLLYFMRAKSDFLRK